jgi:hypothetical protein
MITIIDFLYIIIAFSTGWHVLLPGTGFFYLYSTQYGNDYTNFDMKNATNDKIIGGIPSPIPRVIASNGKNPSPAPPPPTTASAPYIIKRIIVV